MKNQRIKLESILMLRDIRLIVYDFDGVMTNNKVTLREDGVESVVVNRADGLAINMIKQLGIQQIILSTETNKVVTVRAQKLGIPVLQGVSEKKQALQAYCHKKAIPLEKVVYIGNDLNDLEVMQVVGYPVCPSDACREVRNISKIVLHTLGGSGVVREFMEFIMKEKK